MPGRAWALCTCFCSLLVVPAVGMVMSPLQSPCRRTFRSHVSTQKEAVKASSSYRYDSTGEEKSTVELETNWGTNSRAGLGSRCPLAPEPTLGRSATPTVGQRPLV